MAKLSRDDVFKLAKLARIRLTDEEAASFSDEISKILEYVDQLQIADVADLKPTNQVTGLFNVWREDEVIDYGYRPDDMLKNVPNLVDRYIQVGRMIE
jgi:aspartyl-tRNA(Asn)/glutamyl-tRNA(Gln) amidotransferase subunit C